MDEISRISKGKFETLLNEKRDHRSSQLTYTGTDSHRLQSIILAVSASILNTSSDELDEVILSSLQDIFQLVGLDCGGLLKISENSREVAVSHFWYKAGLQTFYKEIDFFQALPWMSHQVVDLGKAVTALSVASLPADAEADQQFFNRYGIQSTLAVPLFVGQSVHSLMIVHSLRQKCIWPEAFVISMRLLGEIFVGALQRRDAFKSLAIHQARFDLAVDSSGVALWEIDLTTGDIWATSKAKELFHFKPDDIITLSLFLEKIHLEDRSLITDAINRAMNLDVESQVEYRVPASDGSNRWMTSRGRVHQKGPSASKVMSGVTLEITRLKKMEQQLAAHVQEISRLRELLEQENNLLRTKAGLDEEQNQFLGNSPAMQEIKTLIKQVSGTNATVLIQGETGTGKELIAQSIHQLSKRNKRLMVTVNCAALPSALIESEMFGREKGAYTGALSRQAGRFEQAHGSTLFLDEIAEMPLETQAKLLRVLQDGTYQRLGSPTNIKVDVRIIAATNRNLADEVEQGRFRRDLFFRLSVFPLQVPPLRKRVEDIPALVWKFIKEFSQKMGRKITRISDEDMKMLLAYPWPGNVRELRNVIERAMITSLGEALDLSCLPMLPSQQSSSAIMTLAEAEYQHIHEILKLTHGKIKGKGGAAELLGINPSTLYSRLRKHDALRSSVTRKGDISPRGG